MKLFKLTFLPIILMMLTSCAVSSQDKTYIMLINSDLIAAGCKLDRLNEYTLPDLPDVSALPLNGDEDIIMVDLLIAHISELRRDISLLKSKDCNNY